MSKILVQTQIHENYGAHDWDGVGACPQHWKAKGGSDYFIPMHPYENATDLVMAYRDVIESDTDYVRESIIDWRIVPDNYITEYEQEQLEYDGKITFPTIVLK